PPTPDISTLSLHDALPISPPGPDDRHGHARARHRGPRGARRHPAGWGHRHRPAPGRLGAVSRGGPARAPDDPHAEVEERLFAARDRKSTRLNSSHVAISYA